MEQYVPTPHATPNEMPNELLYAIWCGLKSNAFLCGAYG